VTDRALTRLHTDAHARAREAGELTDVQVAICERIMLGESVVAICKDEDMPCRRTVMGWIAKDTNFRDAYLAAKTMLAEAFGEEIVAIADDSSRDWVEGENGKVLDHEHVQRSKLRVDARKWVAARLAPKRWGDASMIRVGELDQHAKRPRSKEEIFARLASIAGTLGGNEEDED